MRLSLHHLTVIGLLSVLYGVVGLGNAVLTPPDRYFDVMTHFDSRLSFRADFIWPYLFYYFLLFAPLAFALQPTDLRNLWKKLAAASALAAMVFIVIPTQPSRATNAELGLGFSAWVVSWIYHLDPPANCFPSLHVLHSLLVAEVYTRSPFYQRGWRRFVGPVFIGMALSVCLATVFIKQHYLADVVAAFFVFPLVLWTADLDLKRVRKEMSTFFLRLQKRFYDSFD